MSMRMRDGSCTTIWNDPTFHRSIARDLVVRLTEVIELGQASEAAMIPSRRGAFGNGDLVPASCQGPSCDSRTESELELELERR
jgi:hypothetical protein